MSSPAPGKPSVLLADDSPAFTISAIEILSRAGFSVTPVTNGLDAVAESRRRAYDLVTLDVEMPGMDGIEALRILKGASPDLPVIMVSGASTLQTAVAALRQGADDYILKPPDPDDLVLSVQRALKQRALVEENRKLVADLKAFNEHLEELVRERTAALERSERKLVDYAHDLEKAHAELLAGHEELKDAYGRLRELDGLKAKFISITSHELRTPLTTIAGYAAVLSTHSLPEARQRAALAAIDRNVARLAAIVDEITDIAQLKEKRLYLRREALDLATLLPEVVEELRPLAEGRRQDLRLEMEPGVPEVLADRSRLTQVFSQLVLNAVRFTPDGGQIRVTARAGTGTPPPAVVSVSDTGIGIDADRLETVFTEFYEEAHWTEHHSGTTAFRSGGLGLGLAVVKGLVEEHGGRIRAESGRSYDRHGSTFHVTLPARADE